MMSIVYLFWMYVILFAVIGALRGWAKELMVSFAVIVALTLNLLLRNYVGLVYKLPANSSELFWVRSLIVVGLVFFGYQTVISIPHLASRAARERLQDALFGAFLGAINGYLIAGTLLYYIHQAGYPYPNIIAPPQPNTPLALSIENMMHYMPPEIFGVPLIYFVVILAFVFVLVVYI